MYVCVRVYVCIYAYICMRVCMYVCIHNSCMYMMFVGTYIGCYRPIGIKSRPRLVY